MGIDGMLTSLSKAMKTNFVMQSRCDAKPTVTFPATRHHCSLASIT